MYTRQLSEDLWQVMPSNCDANSTGLYRRSEGGTTRGRDSGLEGGDRRAVVSKSTRAKSNHTNIYIVHTNCIQNVYKIRVYTNTPEERLECFVLSEIAFTFFEIIPINDILL